MTTIRELKARLELEDTNFSTGMKAVNTAMSKFDTEIVKIIVNMQVFKSSLTELADAAKDLDFIAKLSSYIDLLSESFTNMPGPAALKNRFDAIVTGLDEIDKRTRVIDDLQNLSAVLNSMVGMRRIALNVDDVQLIESINKIFDDNKWLAKVYIDEDEIEKGIRDAIKFVTSEEFRINFIVHRTNLEKDLNEFVQKYSDRIDKLQLTAKQDTLKDSINAVLGTSEKWGTPLKLPVDIDFIKKQLSAMFGSASGQTTTSGATLTYNQGAAGQPQGGSDPFSRMLGVLEKIQENTKKIDENIGNRGPPEKGED